MRTRWGFSLARWVPARAIVAGLVVAFHLFLVAQLGASRFGIPFDSAPGAPPAFANTAESMHRDSPAHWNRLVVSRWDSQHYIGLALRFYENCAGRDLRGASLPDVAYVCDFNFYPGYPLLGRIASLGGVIPIDFALFAVSVIASFLVCFWWTGPAILDALGPLGTYASLLLFAIFPTAYSLVALQTEAATLAFTLASFVALHRRWYVLGALLAGAATGIRISGLAVGGAYAIALVASLKSDPPKERRDWALRALSLALAGWGVAVMMGYFWRAFGDPLLYLHSHAATYAYLETPLAKRFTAEFLLRAVNQKAHEGGWIAVCLFFLALGLKPALERFPPTARAYLYALTVLATSVSLIGSAGLGWLGMNRYWLLVLPLFFSMAEVLKKKPVAMALWVMVSGFFLWNIDMCDYVGQSEPGRCFFP